MDVYGMEKVLSYEIFEEQTKKYMQIDNLFVGSSEK